MASPLSEVMTTTTNYIVSGFQHVIDGAINAGAFGDIMENTTGYDVNTVPYVTDGAINSRRFGDGSKPLLNSSGCLFMNLSALRHYDDSEDPISNPTIQLFNRVKATYLIPTLFFVGFPTNCLNMLVFLMHDLKQRINMCLFCLSLVDLIFITFLFVVYVENIRDEAMTTFSVSVTTVMLFIINSHLLGLYGFGWASMFVSTIISAERCFCVIWPLRSSRLLKTRTTAIVLLIGVVLIVAGRFAVTEKYRVICLHDISSVEESLHVTTSRYYLVHKRLVDILDSVVYGLVLPFTSCTFITIATIVTAVKLKQVARWRLESSSAFSAREIALTKMLIYLSIQFIALNLPNILLRMATAFVPDFNFTGRFANLFFLSTGVVEVCAALNSSLNFLVYYFAGTKYRETVHGLWGKAMAKMKTVYIDTSGSNVNPLS